MLNTKDINSLTNNYGNAGHNDLGGLNDQNILLDPKSDNPIILHLLGLNYLSGNNVETINEEMALSLFKKASQKNHPPAKMMLAFCYKNGIGLPAKNEKFGFIIYDDLVKQNFAPAYSELGLCYEIGKGCNKDPKKAFELYQQGYRLQCKKAELNYIRTMIEGIGTEANVSMGIKRLKGLVNEAKKSKDFKDHQGYGAAEYYMAKLIGSQKYPDHFKKDDKVIFELFKRAADHGQISAFYHVGHCYYEGLGTAQNFEKAAEYFLGGVKGRDENAMNAMANCFRDGKGITKSEEMAFQLYSLAMSKGLLEGQYNVALCHEQGIGTPKDESMAFKLMSEVMDQLSDKNSLIAKKRISKYYLNGIGTTRSFGAYLSLLFEITEQDKKISHPDAFINLGLCLLKINQANTRQRAIQLFKLVEESANFQFHPWVYNILAICYQEGVGVAKNIKKSFEYLQKSSKAQASKQDLGSHFQLGLHYLYGIGCEKNIQAAFKCFKMGTKANNPEAINALGVCHLMGWVVNANYVQAREYFECASLLGSNEAKLNLIWFDIHGMNGMNGIKDEQHIKIALQHYYNIALSNEPHSKSAVNILAWCLLVGRGVKQNFALARKLFFQINQPNSDAIATLIKSDEFLGLFKAQKPIVVNGAIAENKDVAEKRDTVENKVIAENKVVAENRDTVEYIDVVEYKDITGNTPIVENIQFTSSDSETFIDLIKDDYKNMSLMGLMKWINLGDKSKLKPLGFGLYCGANSPGIPFIPNNVILPEEKLRLQYYLALCYMNAIGTSKDADIAFNLLKTSFQEGHLPSGILLARCYRNGCGTKIAKENCFKLLSELVCQKHYFPAVPELAYCYLFGIGTEKNRELGLKLLQEAIEGHIPYAAYLLAWCLMHGYGGEVNQAMKERIFGLYTQSIEDEDPAALHNLALCYEHGYGTKQNLEQAFKLYQRAASQNYAPSLNNLGTMYELGIEKFMPKDLAMAFDCYKKAAQIGDGDKDSICNLARCYAYGIGTEWNLCESLKLYQSIGEEGDKVAQEMVERIKIELMKNRAQQNEQKSQKPQQKTEKPEKLENTQKPPQKTSTQQKTVVFQFAGPTQKGTGKAELNKLDLSKVDTSKNINAQNSC